MKLNDVGAKALGIGTLATMAGIATLPIAGGVMATGLAANLIWGVVGVAGVKIILTK